ncbi:hypothetical protein Tco_0658938 [Tanacetum coccineum]
MVSDRRDAMLAPSGSSMVFDIPYVDDPLIHQVGHTLVNCESGSTSMGCSGSVLLVGCGCGGNGKFHGESSCEDDSMDDSRSIKVKGFSLNLTLLVDEALEVLDMVTL